MKILMICYAYPPMGMVGVIRPVKFAKYLPEFGWQPTVLTVEERAGKFPCKKEMGDLPEVAVIRTPYVDVIDSFKGKLSFFRGANQTEKLVGGGEIASPVMDGNAQAKEAGSVKRLIYEMLTIPDEQVGWYGPAVTAGRELMRRERFDAIYSTSPPETAHLIAHTLKSEFGVPWVADLRDLWTLDHFRQRSNLKLFILDKMERQVFRDADALITVSERWRNDLARLHGSTTKPILCIPHGFDEEDYPATPETDSEVFKLVYTGTIDKDFQDPAILLQAVAGLLQEKLIEPQHFQIHFHAYGNHMPDFDSLAKEYGLQGIVKQCAVLEYHECLRVQQSASALLVMQWNSEKGKGNPPLKFYDYLGTRRPILIVGSGEGILGDMIQETGAGRIADSPAKISNILLAWYREFLRTGRLEFAGNEMGLKRYTRRLQTAKLAGLLQQVRQTHS
jgi:glycosyltransferase involved in cell wall biosynthesis